MLAYSNTVKQADETKPGAENRGTLENPSRGTKPMGNGFDF
jgi:hypothetical protein